MKTVNLDFLIEKPVEVCSIEIGGSQYKVQAVKCVEDFLKLQAIVQKFDQLKDLDEANEKVEEARLELVRLIRLFLPTMPEEKLKELFPTITGLTQFFISVLMTVTENFPESVKKNGSINPNPRERRRKRRRRSGR